MSKYRYGGLKKQKELRLEMKMRFYNFRIILKGLKILSSKSNIYIVFAFSRIFIQFLLIQNLVKSRQFVCILCGFTKFCNFIDFRRFSFAKKSREIKIICQYLKYFHEIFNQIVIEAYVNTIFPF